MKKTIAEQVKASKCFGRLYDRDEKTCMCCEAWMPCERETERRSAKDGEPKGEASDDMDFA